VVGRIYGQLGTVTRFIRAALVVVLSLACNDRTLADSKSRGFALIAWPAQYDLTGVMTFLVGRDGVVYDPDESWSAAD
jgi:hypothetical protein